MTAIRWLIRRDMPEVLAIENESFEYAWTEEDFLSCLRQRNCIGMVAEEGTEVVGFMIYELHKETIRLLNFAVKGSARRSGVGRSMARRLIDKLSQQRRKRIDLLVRETNLGGLLFFKAMGFLAEGMERGPYDDTDEDGVFMRYRLVSDESPLNPANRISKFVG